MGSNPRVGSKKCDRTQKYKPKAIEASREVANLTEKKYTYPRIWCQRICPSVCLSVINFDLNYLRTGQTEWAKKNWLFRPDLDSVFRLKSSF